MACCTIRRRRKLTRSEWREGLKNLGKRIFSLISAFKLVQLVLPSGGMSLHVCQPFYRTLADINLVPGVLVTFIIVSGVLLVGHLLNFTASGKLNATFSIVASLCYGWSMSLVMDAVRHEEDSKTWGFLLGKGIVCFAALAVHLLELLHAFVTRDTRPLSLRSSGPSQTVSRTESFVPTRGAV